MKVPVSLAVGALRELCCKDAGLETATPPAANGRVYSDARLDECEYANADRNDVEADSEATIMAAVKVLLQGLGEDVNRDGLKKTPLRVAKAFRDGTRGYCQTIKDIVGGALFPEAGIESGAGCGGGSGGLVVVRNIDLFSYCEACLLPFKVRLHVGYISSEQRVVGLSKLSRVAEAFAKRLQAPQRLADEVSKTLYDTIRPLGVAVVLECWHIQFPGLDGNSYEIKSHNKEMCGWMYFPICAGSGLFEDESSDVWDEFFAVLSLGGINIEKPCFNESVLQKRNWCPFLEVDDLQLAIVNGRIPDNSELRCNGHGPKRFCGINSQLISKLQPKLGVSYSMMITAVESIISAVGEDPRREGLQDTPFRFVWWLLNFCRRKPGFQVNGFDWNITDSQWRPSSPAAVLANTEAVCSTFLLEIDVPFFSQCEHHLLPFFGVAHIGYFCSKEENQQLDRSKINAIVQFFSHKLQVQERLTKQIAETVASTCNTVGVMVVLEARHICMLSRGIEKIGSCTATVAVLGKFATDSAARAAFLQKISSRTAERR
uniref:GTP cyclohydrolase 1 n=1 Tax=Araucaria cunninghamii TaxID=56994 RepID=A0A0D6R084_ARACU